MREGGEGKSGKTRREEERGGKKREGEKEKGGEACAK